MQTTYTYRAIPSGQRAYMLSRGWEETSHFYFDQMNTQFQVFRKERKNNTSN